MVAAGFRVDFCDETGKDGRQTPDYTASQGEETLAVEVHTVSDTDEREAAVREFAEKITRFIKKERKAGRNPGAVGGVVPVPPRFARRSEVLGPNGTRHE